MDEPADLPQPRIPRSTPAGFPEDPGDLPPPDPPNPLLTRLADLPDAPEYLIPRQPNPVTQEAVPPDGAPAAPLDLAGAPAAPLALSTEEKEKGKGEEKDEGEEKKKEKGKEKKKDDEEEKEDEEEKKEKEKQKKEKKKQKKMAYKKQKKARDTEVAQRVKFITKYISSGKSVLNQALQLYIEQCGSRLSTHTIDYLVRANMDEDNLCRVGERVREQTLALFGDRVQNETLSDIAMLFAGHVYESVENDQDRFWKKFESYMVPIWSSEDLKNKVKKPDEFTLELALGTHFRRSDPSLSIDTVDLLVRSNMAINKLRLVAEFFKLKIKTCYGEHIEKEELFKLALKSQGLTYESQSADLTKFWEDFIHKMQPLISPKQLVTQTVGAGESVLQLALSKHLTKLRPDLPSLSIRCLVDANMSPTKLKTVGNHFKEEMRRLFPKQLSTEKLAVIAMMAAGLAYQRHGNSLNFFWEEFKSYMKPIIKDLYQVEVSHVSSTLTMEIERVATINIKLAEKDERLGYWTGKQRYNMHDNPEDVLVLVFDKNMVSFFNFRKLMTHTNIQRVISWVPNEENKPCMISFEPVNLTLSSWIEEEVIYLKDRKLSTGERAHYDTLVCKFTREVLQAVNNSFKKLRIYPELTIDSVFLRIDDMFTKIETDRYTIKVGFPAIADWYSFNQYGEYPGVEGSEVFSALASIVSSLVSTLPVTRGVAFRHLILKLQTCNVFSIFDLNSSWCTWKDYKKIRFFRFMSKKFIRNERFLKLEWMNGFAKELGAIDEHYARKDIKGVAKYSNHFDNFLRYGENTFKHLDEYDADIKAIVGDTDIKVLGKFEVFYPNLFPFLLDEVSRADMEYFLQDSD